jgi:capsular polysaccharide transport system permease protein
MALRDYTARVIRAVLALEVNDLKSRREVYNQLRIEIAQELGDMESVLDPHEIDLNSRLLEHTIRCIESDLRKDYDIAGPDYVPEGLEKVREGLEERADQIALRERQVVARNSIATARGAPAESFEDEDALLRLSSLIAQSDEKSRFADPQSNWPPRRVIWYALLLRRLHETAAASRIAIFWVVLEPVFLIGVVIIGYALIGITYILNMEVAAFAVLGVVPWGMLRVVSRSASNAMTRRTEINNLPPISPLDVCIAEGVLDMLIYTGVLMICLTVVVMLGLAQPPASYLFTGLSWFMLWVNAIALAVLLGHWYLYWPYGRRVAPVIFRGFSMISGLAFVSEQLPSGYREYAVWNPFMHGLQFLRSAYFVAYKSEDASLMFFGSWTIALIVVALLAERAMRPDVVPR